MDLFFFLILILSIPIIGFKLLKEEIVHPTIFGWVSTIGFLILIYFNAEVSPLEKMFLYISSTFLSMKFIVAHNHLGNEKKLNFWQWCLFSYTWFGMNPKPFQAFPSRCFDDFYKYILFGISRIIIGIILILIGKYLSPKISFQYPIYLFYLIGLSLILHFGILNISTGFLRFFGINVTSLFKQPLKSKSLQEFWSNRWNLAFVELTTLAVTRPAKKAFGEQSAIWLSYIFSGLLHELAISLPVNSGFGKPFAFFVVQAFLILFIEKRIIKSQTSNFLRLIWLLACLLLPIFILFHQQFLLQIIEPLADFFAINTIFVE